MSHELISLSPDLKRLEKDGYHINIVNSHLIINHVPYLNSNLQIKYGVMISELTLAGNKTTTPSKHMVYFTGSHPYDIHGKPLTAIVHSESINNIANHKTRYQFSSKPANGYTDYYIKMTSYINILLHQVQKIDPSIIGTMEGSISQSNQKTVFHYEDTNSSRSKISNITNKFKDQKIAIIGLGGTGSYVLDLVAKTPVKEIHLIDGDTFLNHNAFRSPGAASIEDLKEATKKTNYFKKNYSKMHKNIYSHPYHIEEANFEKLLERSFIFICIDKNFIKKGLFDFLIRAKIPFIDVGIGVKIENEMLLGDIRTNLVISKNDCLQKRISFSDKEEDEYSTNIQIAELNALNASLAVIKWKKLSRFYFDHHNEHTSYYQINTNTLINKDVLLSLNQ